MIGRSGFVGTAEGSPPFPLESVLCEGLESSSLKSIPQLDCTLGSEESKGGSEAITCSNSRSLEIARARDLRPVVSVEDDDESSIEEDNCGVVSSSLIKSRRMSEAISLAGEIESGDSVRGTVAGVSKIRRILRANAQLEKSEGTVALP